MASKSLLSDFNKLHWVWKFLLITGGFGLANSIVRRAKCPSPTLPPRT